MSTERKILFLLIVLMSSAPCANAWEFSMQGHYEYRFRWFGRTGHNDIFGNARTEDLQVKGVRVGFAGPNIYNSGALPTVPAPTSNFRWNLGSASGRQMLITRGGFSSSGSDALYSDSRLTLKPVISLNKSMKIEVVYNHGGFRNKYHQNAASESDYVSSPPFERYYMSQTSMNAYDTAAIVSAEQIKGTVCFPFGTLSVGVKDFPFGTGATLGNNTRSDSLLLAVPYGPFRLLYAAWLASSVDTQASWATIPDGTQKNDFSQAAGFTVDQANLSMGALAVLSRYHGNITVPRGESCYENKLFNTVYAKFRYGRFFANAEYAWMNVDRYRPVSPVDGTVALGTEAQTLYMEGNHLFTEAGLLFGPVKLTFLYALASGPVLNSSNRLRNVYAGGFFLGASTPAPFSPGANPKVYTPFPVNYQALEPYEFLMFNTYAGGNNGGWNALDYGFVADEHGMMTDAYCFGGRLDQALASNLNVWASYIWAHRLERAGAYFGQYQASGSLAAGSIPNLRSFYRHAGRSFGTGHDYVSDGFIGWETNVGIEWKLLEGLTYSLRYSYWAPGQWFREAYQSVTFDGAGTQMTTGVLESRDAIQAFQASLIMEF